MFENFDMNAPLGEKLVFALQVAFFGMLMVFLLLIILAICIMIISRVVRAGESVSAKKHAKGEPEAGAAVPAAEAVTGTPLPDSQSEGSLVLTDVDEPTAAVIMAIVSEQSGIPLNRLLFKSIKKVD